MPEQPLQSALEASMDDVLEQMFFIPAESESWAPQQDSEFMVHLTFEGRPSGWFTLCLPVQSARLLAASFLGEEESVMSEDQIGEVICELANIICGATLSRVESDVTFRLSSPRLLPLSERNQDAEPGTAAHAVRIGEGTMLVNFKMAAPATDDSEQAA